MSPARVRTAPSLGSFIWRSGVRAIAAALVVAACTAMPPGGSVATHTAVPLSAAIESPPKTSPFPGPDAIAPSNLGPSVSPSPTGAVARPRAAITDQQGIRIRVVLDSNPMPAGEIMHAHVTVTNTGPDDVLYLTDSCRTVAHVFGIVAGDWRTGERLRGIDARFKALALDPKSARPTSGLLLAFDHACSNDDVAYDGVLAPGSHADLDVEWNGSFGQLGPPATGPVDVVATFERWRRRGDRDTTERREVKVVIAAAIANGRPPAVISPAAAIDAAVHDASFAAWLRAQPERTWINPVLEFDAAARTWTVGLFRDLGPPTYEELGQVTVDAASGQVIATKFQ